MPFHVIDVDTGIPINELVMSGERPRVFASGAAAAQFATMFTRASMGRKYKPKAIVDDNWMVREDKRMGDGTYIKLPWMDEPWFRRPETDLHFAHVSKERDGMVAYTTDPAKGAQDVQARMKPGRYLERFYGDRLTHQQIYELAKVFVGLFEDNVLLLAHTREEIRTVYEEGPGSCMSHKARDFACAPVHPSEVYAAGDLAVAYVRRNGAITARALVWPEKKIASRVYGDETRLWSLLEAAGYRETTRYFYGAKLLRIVSPNHTTYLVMPFVDGDYGVKDMGDHLVLGRDGQSDMSTGPTNGVTGPVRALMNNNNMNERVDDDNDDNDGVEYDDCGCAVCRQRRRRAAL
jgi:hypothetical protein